jgi:hypothetical protein
MMPFPVFIVQNAAQRDALVPKLLSGQLRLPATFKLPDCRT